MDITLPISQDLTLTIADKPIERNIYPTSRLQKGFLMNYRGQDLAEEAVGFGLPVLKKGLQTIFPGNIHLDLQHTGSIWEVTAIYIMDLVEKIARPGTTGVKGKYLYAVKNYLAALIRRFPLLRVPLTVLSSTLRRLFGWETIYEAAGFSTPIKMIYTYDEGCRVLSILVDLTCLPLDGITEVVVMNEQGAHTFDRYRDSSGISLSGHEIGCWDVVTAGLASFESSSYGVAFSLPRVAGARLFRGRELIGSRLAWAGFGYSFPPATREFSYLIRFEKLP